MRREGCDPIVDYTRVPVAFSSLVSKKSQRPGGVRRTGDHVPSCFQNGMVGRAGSNLLVCTSSAGISYVAARDIDPLPAMG